MLDNRPILQKSLIGAGAFGFVFAAAMGGTALMISGGLPFGANEREHFSHRPAQLVTAVQETLSDWAAPETEARTVPANLRPRTPPDEPWADPAPVSRENLAGERERREEANAPATYDFPQVDEPDAGQPEDNNDKDNSDYDDSGY